MSDDKPVLPTPCDACIWSVKSPMWDWSRKRFAETALLTLILVCSASNFDETEMVVIGLYAGALGFDKWGEYKGWKAAVNGWVASKFKKLKK